MSSSRPGPSLGCKDLSCLLGCPHNPACTEVGDQHLSGLGLGLQKEQAAENWHFSGPNLEHLPKCIPYRAFITFVKLSANCWFVFGPDATRQGQASGVVGEWVHPQPPAVFSVGTKRQRQVWAPQPGEQTSVTTGRIQVPPGVLKSGQLEQMGEQCQALPFTDLGPVPSPWPPLTPQLKLKWWKRMSPGASPPPKWGSFPGFQQLPEANSD